MLGVIGKKKKKRLKSFKKKGLCGANGGIRRVKRETLRI